MVEGRLRQGNKVAMEHRSRDREDADGVERKLFKGELSGNVLTGCIRLSLQS